MRAYCHAPHQQNQLFRTLHGKSVPSAPLSQTFYNFPGKFKNTGHISGNCGHNWHLKCYLGVLITLKILLTTLLALICFLDGISTTLLVAVLEASNNHLHIFVTITKKLFFRNRFCLIIRFLLFRRKS